MARRLAWVCLYFPIAEQHSAAHLTSELRPPSTPLPRPLPPCLCCLQPPPKPAVRTRASQAAMPGRM